MRIGHRSPIIALCMALAIGIFASCSNQEAPLMSPTATPGVAFSEAVAPYQLVFISRTYDIEMDQTTYLYQLQNTLDAQGSASGQPATGIIGVFTDVTVELPACAPEPVGYAPPDGATIYTNPNGIHGIEWGVGYDENPYYYYSVTFPGDVPQGVVRGMVKTGGLAYVQDIAGPCDGTFQVAGTVFTDTDGDGLQDMIELGVADVTVQLTGAESAQSVKTDADGHYIFIAQAGDYTISVDSLTADSDFNETLFDAWDPTTPTFRNVTVGPDSFGNSFGFEPATEHIIEAIEDDVYPTNGKTYQWWRKQLKHALQCHGHGDGHGDDDLIYGEHHHNQHWYTRDELLGFIHDIQALAIPYQYQFTPGNELREAYNILNNHACNYDDDDDDDHGDDMVAHMPDLGTEDDGHHRRRDRTCDPVLSLQRELLTTEFNHVTGRGLYTNFPLQYSLISWGEGLLTGASESLLVLPGDDMPNAVTFPEDASRMFGKINGATGGGGTGN